MYHSSFGLKSPPFDDRVDPTVFFSTPDLEETLAAIEYESFHGRGALAVLGEAGTGKTLLIRRVMLQLTPQDQVALWTCPCGAEFSLTREVCKGFKVGVPATQDPVRTLERLRRHLAKAASSGARRAVVILDQVEHLSTRGLHELVDLVSLSDQGDRLVSLVLVGQPRFRDMIAGAEFSALRQTLFGARTLAPFTREQTTSYVLFRLQHAGAGARPVFDSEALEHVHDATGGVPRMINRLCDAAMLAAYGAGESIVSVTSVRIAGGEEEPSAAVASPAEFEAARKSPSAEAGSVSTIQSRSVALRELAPVAITEPLAGQPPSGESGPATRPLADLLRSGSRLLDRLDEALNRTERFHDRAQGVFARYGEFEDHLLEKMRAAERLAERLGRIVDRGQSVLGDVEAKLSEAGARSTEHQAGAAAMVRTCDARIDALSALVQRADRLDAELTAKARTVAGKLDELPRAIQRVDASLLDAEKLFGRLESAQAAASDDARRAEQEAERIQRRLDDSLRTIAEAESRLAAVQIQVASVESSARMVHESLAREHDRLHTLADTTQRVAAQIAETERAAGRVRDGLQQDGVRLAEIEDRRAEVQTRSENLSATLEEIHGRIAEKQHQVQDVERRVEVLRGETIAVESIVADLRETVTTAGELLQQAASVRQEVVDAVRSADGAREALAVARAATAAEIEAVAEERRQVVENTRAAADAHKALAGAIDFARETCRDTQDASTALAAAARQTADRSTEMFQEIDVRLASAQQALADFDAAGSAAARSAETLRELIDESSTARESLAEVSQQTAGVESSARELLSVVDARAKELAQIERALREVIHEAEAAKAAVCVEVDRAEEDVPRTIQALRDSVEQAKAATVQLDGSRRNVDDVRDRLSQLVQSSNEAAERVVSATAKGEQSVSAMEQGIRRATELAAAQRALNDSAASLLERANAMIGCAEQSTRAAAERIGSAAAEVFSMTQATDKVLARLEEGRTLAEQLGPRIEQALGRAEEVYSRLDGKLSLAALETSRLAEGSERATKLVDDLASASGAIQHAADIEGRLQKQLADALAVSEALLSAVEAAPHHAEHLDDANARSVELIERLQELRHNVDATCHDVSEQINARQRWLESGDKLLSEFSSRAARLSSNLAELERRLSETDRAVQQAAHGEVARLIGEARAQAAQLTRVCAAVRKVSASLASQALEARSQAAACEQTRQTTAADLSRLVAETNAATHTLSTWVQEGLRVQSRLERTVRESPPPEKTHPADALRRAARTAQRLQHLPAAPPAARSIPPVEPPARPILRAQREADAADVLPTGIIRPDEVAQLIDEAKRSQTVDAG